MELTFEWSTWNLIDCKIFDHFEQCTNSSLKIAVEMSQSQTMKLQSCLSLFQSKPHKTSGLISWFNGLNMSGSVCDLEIKETKTEGIL